MDEIMRDFGRRLRSLRKRRGMSMRELGKASKISHYSICKYEHDRGAPTAYNAILLARALGVSVGTLLGEEHLPEVDEDGP